MSQLLQLDCPGVYSQTDWRVPDSTGPTRPLSHFDNFSITETFVGVSEPHLNPSYWIFLFFLLFRGCSLLFCSSCGFLFKCSSDLICTHRGLRLNGEYAKKHKEEIESGSAGARVKCSAERGHLFARVHKHPIHGQTGLKANGIGQFQRLSEPFKRLHGRCLTALILNAESCFAMPPSAVPHWLDSKIPHKRKQMEKHTNTGRRKHSACSEKHV